MTAPNVSTPPARQASVEQGTSYVILFRTEQTQPNDGEPSIAWIPLGTVLARDTDKAIEKFSEQHDNKGGTFIAIPASRWKPVKVTPQTVTTLKLEEAKP